MENLISFSKQFVNDHMVLWYRGVFDDNCTSLLIDIANNDLEKIEMKKASGKVAYLLAECFQNVIRHGAAQKNKKEIDGFFGLRNSNFYLNIYSSNSIDQHKLEELESNLTKINSLSKEELREYYIKVLSNGQFNEKGGAGLGFIEMARKSQHPLQFSNFSQNKQPYFCLQIDYDNAMSKTIGIGAEKTPIENNIEVQQTLCRENILMYYKGDFSQDGILPILTILNENSKKLDDERAIKLYHISVEFLQNITHHGKSINEIKQGTFIVEEKEGCFQLTTLNFIEHDQMVFLKQHLEMINLQDKNSLKNWYLNALKESVKNGKNNSGIGLIDVGRIVEGHLSFDFLPMNDSILFRISAKI